MSEYPYNLQPIRTTWRLCFFPQQPFCWNEKERNLSWGDSDCPHVLAQLLFFPIYSVNLFIFSSRGSSVCYLFSHWCFKMNTRTAIQIDSCFFVSVSLQSTMLLEVTRLSKLGHYLHLNMVGLELSLRLEYGLCYRHTRYKRKPCVAHIHIFCRATAVDPCVTSTHDKLCPVAKPRPRSFSLRWCHSTWIGVG